MTLDTSNDLRRAAEHIRAGQLQEARAILVALLRQDPKSEHGWYLLSLALAERERQLECLQRALAINPGHALARARLEKLTASQAPPSQPLPAPPTQAELSEWMAASPKPFTTPPAAGAIPPQPMPAAQPPEATPSPAQPPLLHEKPFSPAAELPPATPAPARPAPRGAAVSVRRPARKGTHKSSFPVVVSITVIVVALAAVLILAVYLGRGYLALIRPTQPVVALATATMFVPPPTRTPTPTFTPIPTRTITPTPTITPLPTLAPPGPTALARMEQLEKQVVNLRGLDPLHDVPRYVTTRPRFIETVKAELFTDAYRLDLLHQEWALSALGLISPTFSLVEYAENNPMTAAAGVYLPWDKEIFVFGLHFTGAEGFVYVHEFDHALVDQHYPFDTLLGPYPTCRWDSQRCEAINALVEGDATLLMYLWWMEYASYEDYRDYWFYVPPATLPSGQEPPPYFGMSVYLPYDYGFRFAQYLYERGGWEAVNRAYNNLPASTEQILHPEKYTAGERPISVADPALAEALGPGWELTSDDSLGEWTTYLLLGYGWDTAAQLDDETAQKAASGWGGDRYQLYRHATTGETVLAAHWIWDTQSAANEFREAFLTYQNRRFSASKISLSRGECWENDQQVSCVLTSGREIVWLIAPNQAVMEALLGKYQ